MSAPDTNIERQKHRHRTMARGIWIGAAVALVVAIAAFFVDLTPLIDTVTSTK